MELTTNVLAGIGDGVGNTVGVIVGPGTTVVGGIGSVGVVVSVAGKAVCDAVAVAVCVLVGDCVRLGMRLGVLEGVSVGVDESHVADGVMVLVGEGVDDGGTGVLAVGACVGVPEGVPAGVPTVGVGVSGD